MNSDNGDNRVRASPLARQPKEKPSPQDEEKLTICCNACAKPHSVTAKLCNFCGEQACAFAIISSCDQG